MYKNKYIKYKLKYLNLKTKYEGRQRSNALESTKIEIIYSLKEWGSMQYFDSSGFPTCTNFLLMKIIIV